MTKVQIIHLLQKYQDGTSNPQENELLENWYNVTAKATETPFPESVWTRKEATYTYILNKHRTKTYKEGIRVKLWRSISVAATVIGVVIGIYFFNYRNNKQTANNVLVIQDIPPGTTGATLILSNGKKIKLSDVKNGKIAQEAGVIISKSANGQLIYEMKGEGSGGTNTISTDNGETYMVSLTDGSKVWLNAASSISYPSGLIKDGRRIVRLSGEAYFEISKDKRHPFVVESAGQEVEVLGTHFNINSYRDEPGIETTLFEGSVSVSSEGIRKIIKPGEQAVNWAGDIKISRPNLEGVLDWKDGDFYLNRVDFKTAMRKISRWYDVEMIYDTSVPNELEIGGWVSRKNNLSTVLKSIEASGFAHFRIEGKKVYVSK